MRTFQHLQIPDGIGLESTLIESRIPIQASFLFSGKINVKQLVMVISALEHYAAMTSSAPGTSDDIETFTRDLFV